MTDASGSSTSHLVWLVTGTSSGFGRILVSLILSRGDCIIATSQTLDKIQDLRNLPEADPSHLRLLQLDVTDSFESVNATVTEAVNVWGRIDVVVNNAGSGYTGLLEEGSAELLMRQYEVNVFGVAKVNSSVLPHMRERRSGTVVIMGSRAVWRPEFAGSGPYVSSKAAIQAYAETLAAELSPFNLRVVIVAPGGFRTVNQQGESNLYSFPFTTIYPHASLDAYGAKSEKKLRVLPKLAKGDPKKAMEKLVKLVKWESVPEGAKWPMWLVLGDDAEKQIGDKRDQLTVTIEKWKEFTKGTKLDGVE